MEAAASGLIESAGTQPAAPAALQRGTEGAGVATRVRLRRTGGAHEKVNGASSCMSHVIGKAASRPGIVIV